MANRFDAKVASIIPEKQMVNFRKTVRAFVDGLTAEGQEVSLDILYEKISYHYKNIIAQRTTNPWKVMVRHRLTQFIQSALDYMKAHPQSPMKKEEYNWYISPVEDDFPGLYVPPPSQPSSSVNTAMTIFRKDVKGAMDALKDSKIKYTVNSIVACLRYNSLSYRLRDITGLKYSVESVLDHLKANPDHPTTYTTTYTIPQLSVTPPSITAQVQNNPNPNISFSPVPLPDLSFADIGGISQIIEDIKQIVLSPLLHANLYNHLGVTAPRGILLHGVSGVGKSLLARAIVGEIKKHQTSFSFFDINATECIAGIVGQSEDRIRDLFNMAITKSPSIILIDDIDLISSKGNTQRDMQVRLISQLTASMDSLATKGNVTVIATTSRINDIDSNLRRPGRFDRELLIPLPDLASRYNIFAILTKNIRINPDFSIEALLSNTPGYVGSDINSLIKEAAALAVQRYTKNKDSAASSSSAVPARRIAINKIKPIDSLYIEEEDFYLALKVVQPAAIRDGFPVVPNITWDQIGGLEEVRKELFLSVVVPLRYPDLYKSFGSDVSSGAILYGPPGCGKTLIAKAIANEASANFISVKGPELFSKYVGDSERAVRELFAKARASSPCVIFFDEIDALAPRRGRSDGGSAVQERVVNQLLTEMDGVTERKNVFLLAATNRLDIIDPALLRPGRFDKKLEVFLPNISERKSIINVLINTLIQKGVAIADLDLDYLAERTAGYSGADLAFLFQEAGRIAARDIALAAFETTKTTFNISSAAAGQGILLEHIELALNKITPSNN